MDLTIVVVKRNEHAVIPSNKIHTIPQKVKIYIAIFIKPTSTLRAMKNIYRFFMIMATCLLAACGAMQSIVLSSIPYTTPLTIPASAKVGQSLSSIGTGSSFDKVIFRNGENVNRINAVRVISAELKAALPVDFDLGQLKSLKVYMTSADETDAVLVATKDNIAADAGSVIKLDLNNSSILDRFIRKPDIRIKMIYTLRSQVTAEANLLLTMNFTATPVNSNRQ